MAQHECALPMTMSSSFEIGNQLGFVDGVHQHDHFFLEELISLSDIQSNGLEDNANYIMGSMYYNVGMFMPGGEQDDYISDHHHTGVYYYSESQEASSTTTSNGEAGDDAVFLHHPTEAVASLENKAMNYRDESFSNLTMCNYGEPAVTTLPADYDLLMNYGVRNDRVVADLEYLTANVMAIDDDSQPQGVQIMDSIHNPICSVEETYSSYCTTASTNSMKRTRGCESKVNRKSRRNVKSKRKSNDKSAEDDENNIFGGDINHVRDNEINDTETRVLLETSSDQNEIDVNGGGLETPTISTTGKVKLRSTSRTGSSPEAQSLYARKRRERINERLRILQGLVPNGKKLDISTMLDEAVHYVKFLQHQIKMLSSDEMWMYAPIVHNGMGTITTTTPSQFLDYLSPY